MCSRLVTLHPVTVGRLRKVDTRRVLHRNDRLWSSICPFSIRRIGCVNGLALTTTGNPFSSWNPNPNTTDVQQAEAVSKNSAALPTTSSSDTRAHFLQGIELDHAVDLQSVRPGDTIVIPYELTITDALTEFWFASFYDQSRIHTSRPFCRSMGLQDRVVPFSLALFLTSSMSHADAAKIQVGFGNVHYCWPIFAGDTLRRTLTVNKIRNTRDGNHSIIYFTCDAFNQRNRLCMRADKRMMFQFPVADESSNESITAGTTEEEEERMQSTSTTDITTASSATTSSSATTVLKTESSMTHSTLLPPLSAQDAHLFRDHLLSKSSVLAAQTSQSLAQLRPGDLIFHSLHRCITFSQSQQLASLARLTHERHFDRRQFEMNELLIPGGLVLGATLSATSRDLHEILHEEIVRCSYVNPLHPYQMVGAISYVAHIDESTSLQDKGNVQVVSVTTLGMKNVHVQRDLLRQGHPHHHHSHSHSSQIGMIPRELFESGLFAKDIEQICKEHCPMLSGKIVASVERKILRQSTQGQPVFLL